MKAAVIGKKLNVNQKSYEIIKYTFKIFKPDNALAVLLMTMRTILKRYL